MMLWLEQFKLYIMGGLAVLVLLLSVALTIQHYRLAAAKSDIKSLTTQLGACQDANTSNLETIKNLKAANTDWATKCGKPGPVAVEAGREVENTVTAVDAALAAAKLERGLLYENDKTAAGWGASVLPSAVAARLHANTGSTNGDR